jgi:putative methylase
MALERLAGFPHPEASLEQYPTPAPLAARLLHTALMRGDIAEKRICDLGAGTGVIAIGASLLGAAKVTGVEIDSGAVKVAEENASLVGTDVEFVVADVADPSLPEQLGEYDTVVMNPPFGAQKTHADRPFIDLALKVAPVTYGIFNAGSRQFIQTYTQSRATISGIALGKLPIRRTFAFHTRDVQEIEVEILRLTRNR